MPARGAGRIGAVAEWSKADAWKVCIGQKPIVGSNPTRSANISLRINETGLSGVKNRQLPRRSGYVIRTSETDGNAKISL